MFRPTSIIATLVLILFLAISVHAAPAPQGTVWTVDERGAEAPAAADRFEGMIDPNGQAAWVEFDGLSGNELDKYHLLEEKRKIKMSNSERLRSWVTKDKQAALFERRSRQRREP